MDMNQKRMISNDFNRPCQAIIKNHITHFHPDPKNPTLPETDDASLSLQIQLGIGRYISWCLVP